MNEIAVITDSILHKIRSLIRNEADLEAVHEGLPLVMLWPMLESIRVIELVVAIEADYGIILPDELLGHDSEWVTIKDLANEVGRLVSDKACSRSPSI